MKSAAVIPGSPPPGGISRCQGAGSRQHGGPAFIRAVATWVVLLLLPATGLAGEGLRLEDLNGRPADPLAPSAGDVLVFLFFRTDCPVSNRYAPEVKRIHAAYAGQGVSFYLVYPDPDETGEAIRTHLEEYDLPGRPLRDPHHDMVEHAGVTLTPEVAVFTTGRTLAYRGRIDNRFVDYGKARPRATRTDLRDVLDSLLDGETVVFTSTQAVGCFIPDLE